MRLNTSSQSNHFLSRKDQLHLFMLVVLLGLIIFAMKKTSEPEFWYWMFPGQNIEKESDQADPVPRQERQLITLASEETSKKEKVVTDQFGTPDQSVIKDNSVGVSVDESSVYYSLLEKVSLLSEEILQKESLKGVGYSVLNEHPDDYRGKLIELKGNLRRLTLLPFAGKEELVAGKERSGPRYYEAWVFTKSSGVDPYRVICTSPESTLPLKQSYSNPIPVKVTGYFFKKQAYASRQGLTTAPLILAGKVTRLEISEESRQPVSRIKKPIVWFLSIFAIALILTIWRYQRSDSRSRLRMQKGKYLRQRLKVPEIGEWVGESDEEEESE